MRLTTFPFATIAAVCLAMSGDMVNAQILKPFRKPAPVQPQVQQPAPVQVQPNADVQVQPGQRERQPQAQREQRTEVREGGTTVRRASFLMKSRVMLSGDAAAGQVVDFILNDHGCIDYVVLSHQEKFFLVPFSVVHVDFHQHVIRLDITQERFRQIPTFTQNEWSTVAEGRFRSRVDSFFGVSTQRQGGEKDRKSRGTPERDNDAQPAPRSKERDADQPDRKPRPESDQPDRTPRPKSEQPDRKPRPESDQPDRTPRPKTEQPDRKPRPDNDQPDRTPRPKTEQPDRTPRQQDNRERPRDDNQSQGSGTRRQQDQ